jgi:hypothetical protein
LTRESHGSLAEDSGDPSDNPDYQEDIRLLRVQQEEHGNCITQLSRDMAETQTKLDDILYLLRLQATDKSSPQAVQFRLDPAEPEDDSPVLNRPPAALTKLLKDKHPDYRLRRAFRSSDRRA